MSKVHIKNSLFYIANIEDTWC